MQEREENLRQQIHNFKRIADERKTKRIIKTLAALSAIIYVTAFMSGGMNGIQDYLLWIIAAPVSAALIMFISALVMLYVFSGALSDEKYLARLQGELKAIQSTRKDVR